MDIDMLNSIITVIAELTVSGYSSADSPITSCLFNNAKNARTNQLKKLEKAIILG